MGKIYSEIRVSGRSDTAVIDIEGVIGVPEKMQFENPGDRVATYERFTESLGRIAEVDSPQVTVNIRSTGGDVNDALLIYEALRSLRGEVVTRCYGYVASAATIIAQAASPGRREVSANALYLIHCSESAAEGNSGMLSRTVELLDKTDGRIAGIYAARSGMDAAGFALLMRENNGKGRWLSAEETIEAGLADKIIEPERVTNEAEPTALADALGEVAAMLGITEFPAAANVAQEQGGAAEERPYEALRNFVRRIFAFAAKRRAAVGTVEQEPDGAAHGYIPAVELPDDSAVVFRLRDAQSRGRKTETLPREDPSAGEPKRSPNEQAYYEDCLGFRNR